LDELTARALEVLGEYWDLEAELFCKRLSDTRNWLIHWGDRGKETVEDPAGLVELLDKLVLVLYLNTLLDLGLDNDEAAEAVGSGWRLEDWP